MISFTKNSKMEEEVWKDIEGYEGYYQVSSFGRVKSLDRSVPTKNGRILRFKSVMLKLKLGSNGYLAVELCKDAKLKTAVVHRIMATTFLNHTPDKSTAIVDHKDGVKTNNYLTNLQIISNRENTVKGMRCKNTESGFIGVRPSWSRWKASIRILTSEQIYLGTTATAEEASELYQKALDKFLSNEEHYKEVIFHLSSKEKKEYLIN